MTARLNSVRTTLVLSLLISGHLLCFHKQRTTYVRSIWMTQSVGSASSEKSLYSYDILIKQLWLKCLFFWGGGCLPGMTPTLEWHRIWSEHLHEDITLGAEDPWTGYMQDLNQPRYRKIDLDLDKCHMLFMTFPAFVNEE